LYLPFFGLLDVSEAICCILPTVEPVKQQQTSTITKLLKLGYIQYIYQIGRESKMCAVPCCDSTLVMNPGILKLWGDRKAIVHRFESR
jgi:hypothetical protein